MTTYTLFHFKPCGESVVAFIVEYLINRDMIEQTKQPRESINVQSNQPQMVTRGRKGKKLQGQLNK